FSFLAPVSSAPYTLSLHDALPICAGPDVAVPGPLGDPGPGPAGRADGGRRAGRAAAGRPGPAGREPRPGRRRARGRRAAAAVARDRKSTRLNSSHQIISYAVFCLK